MSAAQTTRADETARIEMMTGCAKTKAAGADWGARRLGVACVAGMVMGLAGGDAYAQDVITPNRPYAGCELSAATLASLRADIQTEATATALGIGGAATTSNPGGAVQVDVVVVYRLDTSNWGQPIYQKSGSTQAPTGDFTARVLCARSGVFGTRQLTDEDDRFPNSGSTVNVLDADETLGLRVEGASGSDPGVGKFAAKLCLTSKPETGEFDSVDCVRYNRP